MPSRADAIIKRQQLLPSTIRHASRCIARQLPPFLGSIEAIVGYYPHQNEPNLLPLYRWCQAQKMDVYLPTWNGADYTPRLWKSLQPTRLVRDPFGILNPLPTSPILNQDVKTVWLVPGLWFTKYGHRMGYGKGIYDRMLTQWNGIKIGIGYHWQLVDTLPQHPGDYQLNHVITNLEVEAA